MLSNPKWSALCKKLFHLLHCSGLELLTSCRDLCLQLCCLAEGSRQLAGWWSWLAVASEAWTVHQTVKRHCCHVSGETKVPTICINMCIYTVATLVIHCNMQTFMHLWALTLLKAEISRPLPSMALIKSLLNLICTFECVKSDEIRFGKSKQLSQSTTMCVGYSMSRWATLLFLKDKTPILCKRRNTFCSVAKALKRSRRVSLTQPSTTSRLKGVCCDTAAKFSCTTGRCVAAKEKHTDTHTLINLFDWSTPP